MQAAAFRVAAGMALFTIVFGTGNQGASERHHSVFRLRAALAPNPG